MEVVTFNTKITLTPAQFGNESHQMDHYLLKVKLLQTSLKRHCYMGLLTQFTQDGKILDWSKLKQIADDVLKCFEPFPKLHILYSSKLEDFADDNLEFDENGTKLSKQVENTVGKGEIARNGHFLVFPESFPPVFSRLVMQTCVNQGLFWKGLKWKMINI